MSSVQPNPVDQHIGDTVIVIADQVAATRVLGTEV